MTVLALATAVLLCAGAAAQAQGNSSSAPYQTNPVPAVSSGDNYKTTPLPAVENIAPSSFHPLHSANAKDIAYVAEEKMTEADRQLVKGAEPSIREGATFAGFELGTGKWNYQQIECQALPDHILLLFKGDNGAGDVSLFSAAIPRSGHGRIRVIAIQRRGYSLFLPASENPLSISAFNQIRADEPASKNSDWLATALCYAALTGAHPENLSTARSIDELRAFPLVSANRRGRDWRRFDGAVCRRGRRPPSDGMGLDVRYQWPTAEGC